MQNPLEVLRGAAPVRVPVERDKYDLFFGTLIRYLDQPDLVRMIYDTFGSETTARFISIFHGLTLTVKPRDFWVRNFQVVDTFLALHGLNKEDMIKKAESISARTGVPSQMLLQTYVEVAQKLKQHR